MKEWVKMPSKWLCLGDQQPLTKMRWQGDKKSDYVAALMLYIAMLHHVNDEATRELPDIGCCKLTYDALTDLTNLSRAKVAAGLNVLYELKAISNISSGKASIYKIHNYPEVGEGGWAKLPAKGLYSIDYKQIRAFKNIKLRSKIELNALKIYLLLAVFRDNKSNTTRIGYTRLSELSGVRRNDIKAALSLLITLDLIKVDGEETNINEYSTVNIYRLCHLEEYKHKGNTAKPLVPLQHQDDFAALAGET